MALSISKIRIAEPSRKHASRAIMFLYIALLTLNGHVEERLNFLACQPSEDGNARSRSLLPVDSKFITSHRHIRFLRYFIERLGGHAIAQQDADKRRK